MSRTELANKLANALYEKRNASYEGRFIEAASWSERADTWRSMCCDETINAAVDLFHARLAYETAQAKVDYLDRK